jgi:hypothetical protein
MTTIGTPDKRVETLVRVLRFLQKCGYNAHSFEDCIQYFVWVSYDFVSGLIASNKADRNFARLYTTRKYKKFSADGGATRLCRRFRYDRLQALLSVPRSVHYASRCDRGSVSACGILLRRSFTKRTGGDNHAHSFIERWRARSRVVAGEFKAGKC